MIEVVVSVVVLVAVVEVFCSVRMGVGVGGVGDRGVVEEMLVWLILELMVEELGGGIVAGSPMGFSESSGKTSHIVSHSHSILLISFCRLACKEEEV